MLNSIYPLVFPSLFYKNIKKYNLFTKIDKNNSILRFTTQNAVFINLKAKGNSIYYYSNARECDFVIQEKSKITKAIQITAELNSNNRTREIEGLLEALNKFKLKNGLILTLDQKETIKIENKVIEVEPAWKWLIEN